MRCKSHCQKLFRISLPLTNPTHWKKRYKIDWQVEWELTHLFVDGFYTVFKVIFNDSVRSKTGQIFGVMERTVNFNQYFKKIGRVANVPKKRLLRKHFKKHDIPLQRGQFSSRQARQNCCKASDLSIKRSIRLVFWDFLLAFLMDSVTLKVISYH